MKKSQSIQYFIFAFLIGLFSLSADASLADKHSDQDYPNNEFLNSVYEKVQYNLVYPEKAKEENREGIVKVRFLLKKDGSIEGLEIEESSGCPLLDKAALDAVRDASPYPFPFTDRDEILLILPVGFGSGLTAEAQAQPSLQQYTQILLNQISPFLIYPKEAQDKGISGTVKVGLVVNREGNIDELEIKESSGSKLLDDAALKAIKKAYPLPFPFTDKKEIRMLLPVSFGIELTGYQPKAEVKETATTSLPENETLNSVAPASSMSIQEYIKLIAGKISTNIAYPEQASLKAGQADVRIKFMIAKDGSVRSAEIEKSSGYLDLDKAVIMAINKSAPYPFPFTDKDTLSLLLPISFDLNGQSEYQEIKNPELQTGPTPITSPEEYREALLKKISSFLIYPQEAKNKGLSGTVKLKFLVTKDGLPRRIEIKESSGLDILDKAALEAITNASPYPFPFADKEELEVTIPIAFGLEIPRFKPRQDKADFQTMTVQEYRRVLLRQILNQVSFPDSAKEKGLSGLVKVAFRVKKDGSIDNLGIEQSSNFPELDKAAIDAVSRGVPYP
ncbi:MAG: TonB family protein, partial [Candidatus Omnitrophica bacterium]|nr:TonB family protein [Candidatus Omnitrophota bacterium]